MSREDIIHMAREADALGYVLYAGDEPNQWMFSVKQLERFAALIASRVAAKASAAAKAEEREACAKVCEEVNWYDRHEAAAAIRARGNP